MNKITAHTPLHQTLLTQQGSQAPAHFSMAPCALTPLMPPGGTSSGFFATRTEPSQVPQWRLALFEQSFGQIQQKLAERRQTGSEVGAQISGGLAGNEFRECDAAAQWVSACLMQSGAR